MFKIEKRILLKETDATGVIYFTQHFNYAMEAFETYLHSQDEGLALLFQKEALLPVVHARSDFKAPLVMGDLIAVELVLQELKVRSFWLKSVLKKEEVVVGTVEIAHAVLCKEKRCAIAIPPFLKTLLENL